MRFSLFLIACFLFFSASAQIDPFVPAALHTKKTAQNNSAGQVFAKMITPERLRRHLTVIASDAMEGRETGQPGLKKAAKYITGRLANYHIAPFGQLLPSGKRGYEQPFYYHKEKWTQKQLVIKGVPVTTPNDFAVDISTNPSRPTFNIQDIVFLGYGIDDPGYSDYQGQSLAGKTIIILSGEPRKPDGTYAISHALTPSEWSHNDLLKLQAAQKHGVQLVFILTNQLDQVSSKVARSWTPGQGLNPKGKYANNIYISTQTAQKILGKKYRKLTKCQRKINKKGKPKHFRARTNISGSLDINRQILRGANLLAVVEGSDPKLKNEYVYITAHYDHLGMRGEDIFNGADDNGSGTSSLIEIAHAFAQAKESGLGAKRSLIFMWQAGEEKGLLGSEAYVNHPIVPLKHAVADINIDMIGRVDAAHEGHPDYIYVIGANRLSTALDQIVKDANVYTHLDLDYKYNADDDPNRFYYRSDHYNFAKHNIPAVFFFNGTHEDYHRPSDTIDKINFKKMAKIAQLAFYTGWEIASRKERLKVDVPKQN